MTYISCFYTASQPALSVKEIKFVDPNGDIELHKIAKGKANATATMIVGDPDAPESDPKKQQEEMDKLQTEMDAMIKGTFGS